MQEKLFQDEQTFKEEEKKTAKQRARTLAEK